MLPILPRAFHFLPGAIGLRRACVFPPGNRGWVAVCLLIAAGLALPAAADEKKSILSKAKFYGGQLVDSVSAKLGGMVGKAAPSEGDTTSKAKSPDEELLYAARNQCLDSIFVTKDGYYFTQSRWEETAVPYQLRGVKIGEPQILALKVDDRANGIDRRVAFGFQVEGFRRYHHQLGWTLWTMGSPPELVPITLVRTGGRWRVESSPMELFSVPGSQESRKKAQ